MKTSLKLKLGTLAIGTLALTSTLTQAQTTAPGPYYATPSWDQTLPTSTRFIVLSNMNNEAVLDRETGFVWERTPSANIRNFRQADLDLCNPKVVGGRMGWRVPSVWELLTLVDPTRSGPALPAGHPFNLSGNLLFWTNSPVSVGLGSTTAYAVFFDLGNGGTALVAPDSFHRAWCVRGPGGAVPISPTLQ
jgi:Protein of unknown function (DUF1566)